ncbi:MAG: efflux RND transporter permease subunit, partial [Nitrospirae bacterium]
LIPEVVRPQITVTTDWPGAAPGEVEREVVARQEEVLKGVEGVVEMRSESREGRGRVVLTFLPGTSMDAASVRVGSHLSRVRRLPRGAERPVVSTVDTQNQAIAWFSLEPQGEGGGPAEAYLEVAEDLVKPRLERVPGVARSNVYGGREREIQVVVDPAALAARGLTLAELAAALERESAGRPVGELEEGGRRYRVRALGELDSPAAVAGLVLPTRGGTLRLGEVARVRLGRAPRASVVHENGRPAIALSCLRAPGANVLEEMAGLKAAVAELNAGPLAARGLRLRQVYDETGYIRDAIRLVVQNAWLGGALAVAVLLLFLRAWRPTLVVALSIPVSVVGTFLLMRLAGRSLNVVSLAGIAFATGMVVDNAIVVLENCFRHHEAGEEAREAAVAGTAEVWGAILASTLTTVAVFLPILFVAQEAGQLFRDLALAISAAVALSLG